MMVRDKEPNPSQVDRLLVITRPMDWLSLWALVLLLVALGGWMFLGNIPVKVSGEGMLAGSGGIRSISASTSGEISDLLVKEGDVIKKGDVLCHLNDPGMLVDVALPPDLLGLLKQGGPRTAPSVVEESLGFKVRYRKRVLSPYDGMISRVFHREGDRVTEGTRLFRVTPIMTRTDAQLAYVLVPARHAPQISVGIHADVYPQAVSRQRYGSLVGVVEEVGSMPISLNSVRDQVSDEHLAERIMGTEPKILVKVLIQRNPANKDELLWSSGAGPAVKLEELEGSACAVDMTISNEPAIELLSPNAQ